MASKDGRSELPAWDPRRESGDSNRRHMPRHSRPHPFAPSRTSSSASVTSAQSPGPRTSHSASREERPLRARSSIPPPAPTMALPGGHPLSLKVMRVSQPTLAATDWPYFEADEYSHLERPMAHRVGSASDTAGLNFLDESLTDWERSELASWYANPGLAAHRNSLTQIRSALELESRSSMVSNTTHNVSDWQDDQVSLSTLRDFPISELLMLPASFGTVYEGETFSAFVCINNESPVAVEGVSLHIEMHSGPGAVSSAQAGTDAAASVNVVPLAHVTTNNSSTTSEFGGSLAPRNKLEALINYPVTEPGPHGLVCTVSYFVPQSPGTDSVYASLLQDGSGRLQRSTMIETYFRKFYRFQVAQAPLETEARVLSVQTASMLQCQANPYIRERVLLQVTLINRSSAGAPPMAIETVEPGCDENASAAPRWYWRQLDQPEVRCSWWDDDLLGLADSPGKSQNYKEVLSASSSLGGTLLLPGESRQIIFVMYPTRPMRHAPLPPHSTMDSSRKQPSSQTGDVEETYALSKQHTTFTSPVQLGFVKTLCRSYMGEPTIVRSAPVVHLPSFPQPTTVTSPHETLLQPSGMHETDHTASPPKGKSVRPDLQLQTELLVLSTPSEVTAEEPFDLEYDLWLRDVNLAQSDALARRQSGARTSANLGGDEIEDEDDRPLSEVASDVARSQDGSKAGSARSSRASSVHGTPWLESRSPSSRRTLSQLIEDQVHQLEHQRPPVWLKLAVQLTRIGPYPSPLSTTSPEPASLPAPGLERQGTVKAPSVAAPLGYLARRPLGDSTDTAHQVSHASSISSRTLSSASATIVPASHSQRSASVRDTASSFLSPAFQRGGFVQRRESSSTLSTSTATPSFSYSSLPPAQADRTAPSPSPSSVAQLHASEASRPQSSFWPSPVVIEGSAEAEDSSSPDPDVVPLGASLLPLPPIRLAPGQPATSVRFAASYLTSRSGTARIGGPRILLVDWWNETQDPNMDPAVSPDSYSPDVAVNLLDLARATIAEVEVA